MIKVKRVLIYDAMLIFREITEVELEAIAVSRMGRVYDRVLKLKYRAKEYYKLAIQLAHSMHPRTFAMEGKSKHLLVFKSLLHVLQWWPLYILNIISQRVKSQN